MVSSGKERREGRGRGETRGSLAREGEIVFTNAESSEKIRQAIEGLDSTINYAYYCCCYPFFASLVAASSPPSQGPA